eukprot:2181326-Amphidinium_carterae.3
MSQDGKHQCRFAGCGSDSVRQVVTRVTDAVHGMSMCACGSSVSMRAAAKALRISAFPLTPC